MPYLTSGLLAFKKPTASMVMEFGEWIRENCKPSATYLVQLDEGRSLAIAVESLSGDDRVKGEVGHFVYAKTLGDFARWAKRPMWGGFAEGGYSNSQTAIAVDAKGKKRWSSRWDFQFPAKVEEQGLYPLVTPADVEQVYADVRAKNGYGRIGTELKADFYKLLSIERGDPLMTVNALSLDEKTTEAQLAKWLSKYKPVKKAPLPPPADQIFVSFDGAREKPSDDVNMLVMLTALACSQRKLPLPRYTAFGSANSVVFALSGPAVKTLSLVFQRNPFSTFLSEQREASVRVLSVKKGKLIASNGRVNSMIQMRGGPPLSLPEKLEWQSLPAIPKDMLTKFDAVFRKWAKRKAKEAAEPQITLSGGFGMFG